MHIFNYLIREQNEEMQQSFNAAEQPELTGNRVLQIVAGTLDPRRMNTAPPAFSSLTAFKHEVTKDMSSAIVDDALLVNEKVPSTSGLILDFVQRGVGDTYRMGIVPARATSNQVPIPYITGSEGTPNGDLSGLLLIYNSPVPIPYFDDGINQIQVGPNLAENFSLTRTFSSVLTVLSDTVPIGNTSTNGMFTGSAIADTRDMITSGSGIPTAFDIATLLQCSVNAKDAIKDVSVTVGMTSILGPDIPVMYGQPSLNNVVMGTHGGSFTHKCNYVDRSTVTLATTSTTRMTLYTAFASPCNVGLNAAAMGTLSNSNWTGLLDPAVNPTIDQFTIPQINICGSVRYRIEIRNYNLRQSPSSDTVVGGPTLHITATDIFASALTTGAVKYTTRSCTKTQYLPAYNTLIDFAGNMSLVFDMDQADWSGSSLGTTGAYIGTFFRMFVLFDFLSGGSYTTVRVPIQIEDMYITCLPTSIYQPGELGPVRVIRWDNMSAGQVLRVSGMCNVQCVAQGSIAPFVQNAALRSDTGINLNVYPMLYELFNGYNIMFRRIWSHDDYLDMLDHLAEHIAPERIMIEGNNKLITAAHAAGLFDGCVTTTSGGARGKRISRA